MLYRIRRPTRADLILTAAQCRAARSLLGWTQAQLGMAADVAQGTVSLRENGRQVKLRCVLAMRDALGRAGVEFLVADNGQPSVRLQREAPPR